MTSEEIGTGDVVIDLSSGSSMQVVSKLSQRAAEHAKVRSDATNQMFGMEDDDAVFNCVFLPESGERASAPSKSYAYPESRLLRYPVENATQYENIQNELRTLMLEELVDAAFELDQSASEFDEERVQVLLEIVESAYSLDVAKTLHEWADVRLQEDDEP